MIKNFVKILELLGDRLEVCVSVYTKISPNEEVYCFKSLRCCIYHAIKCLNANNCWHFNIYEQDKWKKFYNLQARPQKQTFEHFVLR